MDKAFGKHKFSAVFSTPNVSSAKPLIFTAALPIDLTSLKVSASSKAYK